MSMTFWWLVAGSINAYAVGYNYTRKRWELFALTLFATLCCLAQYALSVSP